MRTLIFDIETAPLLAHVWQARTDWVPADAFVHDSFLLSWAAKWETGRRVHGAVLTPTEARNQDDGRIVGRLADLVREADQVVAHNVDRFDVPMLNNRLLLLGAPPLGNVRTIDTLKLAKKSFRLASNKLDYLAGLLLGERKIKTDFDLWRRAYRGEARALAEMYRYNRKDVTLLQDVYEALKPYVRGLPRLVDARHDGDRRCPSCGEDALIGDGYYRTNASTFRRLRCKACGRNSRVRQAEPAARLAHVPLA